MLLRKCVGLLSRHHVKNNSLILVKRPSHGVASQLSVYDVNIILRENEYSHIFPETETAILSFESNQLASNNPCEDARTEGSFIHNNAFICGIFDGHAGPSCAQVISKRLLRYLAASLVDRNVLIDEIAKECTSQSFLKCHNDKADFVTEIKDMYEHSFSKYVESISSQFLEDRTTIIENAFLRLDHDLSEEALKHTNMRTLSVAMSGAVACVAHIEENEVHVANTGDCCAVLGIYEPNTKTWQPRKLSVEHNSDNLKEVERILSEHPAHERDTAIRNERLLGQLAPLRAFGDFRYKWSNDTMEKYVVPTFGEQFTPPCYYTPPYLTALPEVVRHVLTPNDKFLVIASDGLWDFLSPSHVVNLVGEHITSKKILKPLVIPDGEVNLEEIAKILEERRAGRANKPLDQNAATHLIRNALGGTEFGIEHSKISYYLSLPQDVVRLYRDDITITVIYFNSDYIEKLTKEQNRS